METGTTWSTQTLSDALTVCLTLGILIATKDVPNIRIMQTYKLIEWALIFLSLDIRPPLSTFLLFPCILALKHWHFYTCTLPISEIEINLLATARSGDLHGRASLV